MSKEEPVTALVEEHNPISQPPQHPHLPLSTTSAAATIPHDYRKGNWTIEETLILISAKKLDDERRLKLSTAPSTSYSPSARGGEQRWKWVENYCYARGCFRSQNQCNDKWDNLLRDFKKVRNYESRYQQQQQPQPQCSFKSYWTMEKHERKDRNLPSNLSPELFDALSGIVLQHRRPCTSLVAITERPPPPPPLPLPPAQPLEGAAPPAASAGCDAEAWDSSETHSSSETCTGDTTDDPRKRKKIRSIASSIARSAAVLAKTLRRCEVKREKRHKELMEMEQQRLEVEERRTEVNRQGIATLVTAVNNLSGAIKSITSDRRPDHSV